MELFSRIVPPLSYALHKGQAGRVGIIGGSFEYTGAPFYSAITSIKLGVDLVHIFCDKSAAVPLKSYSPDFIVHPYIDSSVNNGTLSSGSAAAGSGIGGEDYQNRLKETVQKITPWIDKLHGVLIGPGAGRDRMMMDVIRCIIPEVIKRNLPIVIDADGLYAIQDNLDLIRGYHKAVITPNVAELKRLCDHLDIESGSNSRLAAMEMEVCSRLEGVLVASKGKTDILTNNGKTVFCDEKSGVRRCGGQGDILAGAILAFNAWTFLALKNEYGKMEYKAPEKDIYLNSVYMACKVTRRASYKSFEKHGRANTSSDIVKFVPASFESLFKETTNVATSPQQ